MGERTVRIRKVAGSIPVRSTKIKKWHPQGCLFYFGGLTASSGSRPLRGDQFPGDPRWLSGQAGTFYPLTALSQRNLAPWQTHPTSRDCQGTAPRRGASLRCGRNLRFPHKRPLPEMRRRYLFLPFCFTSREHQRIALHRSGRSQRGMRTNPSVQRRWPT